ncbi:aldehyde dehydrogenase family protein [Nocardioides sp. cx-173]|uniref:aldehyde dehydrogenase family protein n=1 Tax=Nocardioides sp. cx-173 TaxID=2898796 RepID=UPI001E62D3DB|nr:aldehyde dehydrogenase family protein [Nocardioides sp. cx-173]MCD4524395.1 aldehyde dehydrogenase family protein [Nocardioides sp. cx-173]UGB43117.1 aldehyde dehydrogenase family protein [Nocardioides sp. cx-173]
MITRENPARTDELVGTVCVTTPAQVDRALERARDAQRGWAALAVPDRAGAVRAATGAVEPVLEELAELMARETGKVLGDSRGELAFALTVLRWAADRAEALLVDRELDDTQGRLLVRHRPFGVVGAITPWNAPVVLAALKVGPALAAGNAVVVKPSPLAPFAVQRFLETVAARLPAGLLQVVQGHAETAAALVGSSLVDRVAFTGGESAGRAIGSLAGRALTPALLELGGNDPAVLLHDVVLDDGAADRLLMAAFATSGQVCMAVKRLYVHRSRYDEAVEALRAAADRMLCVGDPLHDGVSMGPVVSGQSADRVSALVAQAVAGGAEALVLGSVDAQTDLGRGYFVRPSLVLGAGDADPLVAAEQFGPALPVLAFDDEEEVLARANAGDLGLGASVWSADEEHAFALGARMEAGFTFVNTHNRTGLTLRAPFGGVKRSGWGREYGDEGVLEYVQPCVVHAPAAFRAGGAPLAAAAYPTG